VQIDFTACASNFVAFRVYLIQMVFHGFRGYWITSLKKGIGQIGNPQTLEFFAFFLLGVYEGIPEIEKHNFNQLTNISWQPL
jgi:hypothetical protein